MLPHVFFLDFQINDPSAEVDMDLDLIESQSELSLSSGSMERPALEVLPRKAFVWFLRQEVSVLFRTLFPQTDLSRHTCLLSGRHI